MAHAGDGGGSIRIPAAACGLFGLKPTRARNPIGPELSEGWSGFVSEGVVSRTVRDTAAMLDATHGPESGAPYVAPHFDGSFLAESRKAPSRLRIAFRAQSLFGDVTHPDCVAAVRDAAKLCESLGHDVVEASPRFDRDPLVRAYLVIVAVGVAAAIAETETLTGRKPRPSEFEPTTWFLGQAGRALHATDLQTARVTTHAAGRDLACFHDAYDVLITPTLATPPMKLGTVDRKAWELAGLAALRHVPEGPPHVATLMALANATLELTPNTMLFNQTGQPAMNVPLFWNEEGLPIGVQFSARFGDDAGLLRLAGQLESARPWANRVPPIRGSRGSART
jgi:amidase